MWDDEFNSELGKKWNDVVYISLVMLMSSLFVGLFHTRSNSHVHKGLQGDIF